MSTPPPLIELRHLTPEQAAAPRWIDLFLKKKSVITLAEEAQEIYRTQECYPVIVDRQVGARLDISRHRYLVRQHQTLGHLYHIIRKGWKPTDASLGLHFMIMDENGNATLGVPSMLVSQLYPEHKWSHGAMVIVFCAETTFG